MGIKIGQYEGQKALVLKENNKRENADGNARSSSFLSEEVVV